MAYNLNGFLQKSKDLGSITFDGTKYEIIKITTYESGNQVLNLLNTETCEEIQMTFWKPEN